MFRLARPTLLFALQVGLVLAGSLRAEQTFPLKNGDTWVMAGDSITAQHLHSNYFEAFCYARYPQLEFRFRNSGVGGDTIGRVMARFDWDVAAWKPTVVSVELGMNDQGRFTPEQFIENMRELDAKIRRCGARPVYFTSSPVNNGDTMAKLGGNARLDKFAEALGKFSAEMKAPFADQFHALIDPWGKNKPNEARANLITTIMPYSRDDKLAGVEHLRAFLAEQAKLKDRPVSMQGDPVHPGPPGQLMMAAALLKALGADPVVSSATLDATGKVVAYDGCTITNASAKDGVVTFDRLDERLPFPIPANARDVLAIDPTILDLSQYTLKVTGLPNERYDLRVNGAVLGQVSSEQLAAGVNLTSFERGPIAEQSTAILAAVDAKEREVAQWRQASFQALSADSNPEPTQRLERQTKLVVERDAQIRAAAKPKLLHFELRPAK